MTYSRDAVTWASFGALFGFGFLNAVLGPALPFLRDELGLTYLTGALHQVAFALGGGTAGLLAASERSRLSRRTTVVGGLLGAGVAGLGIGFGPVVGVTLVAAYLVSACATSALIAVWATLSDVHAGHRAVAMTEGEIAVSLAGVATPLVVGLVAATVLGWRWVFVVGAVVALAAAAGVRVIGLPAPLAAPAAPPASESVAPRRLPATLLTIFAVVGLEFVLSFWLASYLHDDVGLPAGRAASLVAVMYAAHLAGRVATSRLARRTPPRRLIVVALLVVVLGAPALLTPAVPWLVVVGIAVTGVGTGATFPLASSLHVQASPRGADGALGQTLTVAALAQVVGPLGAGALAQATDLRVGLLLVPAFAVLGAVGVRAT